MVQAQYHFLQLCVLISSALAARPTLADETAFGPAGEAVSDTCQEAAFFASAARKLKEDLKADFQLVSNLWTEASKWRLGAARTADAELKAKITALQLLSEARLSRALAAYSDAEESVTQFAARASRWAGALVGQATTVRIPYTISGTPERKNSGTDATANLEPKGPAVNPCPTADIKSTTPDGKELKLDKARKVKISADTSFLQPNIKMPIQLATTDGSSANRDTGSTVFLDAAHGNGFFKTHASAGNKGFTLASTGGTISGYTGATGTNIGTTDTTPGTCTTDAKTGETLIPEAKQITQALCNSLAKLGKGEKEVSKEDPNSLANNPEFQAIVNNLLPPTPNNTPLDLTNSEQQKQLIDHIKAAYETSSSAFQTTFVTAISGATVGFSNGKQTTDTTIGQLAGKPTASTALSSLMRTVGTIKTEKSIDNEKAIKKEEAVCENKGKDNCESEKCELKGDKCVQKDGAEAEQKKKEDKCTGKEQKECEKATECKWEGETCKDSSILVNKQFALMVSAFVSIL
uniref:Variant surface glycoprotein 1125.1686 n=1 Tax=Trypanosoma brucei TaxID=5691 RepID=M4T1L8_9TRYP|nr:variant surface glycoprotein 376 [Trypanosoma brucei]APD73841.1 variant surface glycoprotein 1125.1686 [Trypanosoma brucei]